MPHIHILSNYHCDNTLHETFKRCGYFKYVLCLHDYVEWEIASFAHQTQSEYYVWNRSVSIEGIALENFSFNTHHLPLYVPKSKIRNAVCSLIFVWWHKIGFCHHRCTQRTHHWIVKEWIYFMILVPSRIIQIADMITTDVPLHHFYCQCRTKPII